MNIRRATESDWPNMWPIMRAVVAGGDTYMLAPDCSETEAREYWMGIPLETYIAEDNGEVVGTYAMRVNQRGLGSHVANAGYMVRPGNFGKGIGAALCKHSLEMARAQGFLAMQFNAVVSTNARAVALWQRMGFAIVGTVPKAYLHSALGYVDIYVMHRIL
ncbi:MAG: GNAT family N-acetyltransferase [Gemmatimonadaceae bacterium]